MPDQPSANPLESPSAASRPHKKQPPRLHPASAVLIVAAFVTTFWKVGVFSGHASMTDAIIAFVTPLLAMFFGLILGLLVFFVFKRSGAAFNLMFGAVLCLAVYIVCSSPRGRAPAQPSNQSQAAVAGIERMTADLIERQRRAKESGKPLSNQDFQELADQLKVAGDKAVGGDASVVKALVQPMRDIGAAGTNASAAKRNFTNAGGIRPATLKTRADIDQRLDLVNVFEKANTEYERVIATIPQAFAQSLKNDGVSDADARAYTEALRGRLVNPTALCRIRSDYARGARSYLNVLASNWDHHSEKDGKIVFQNDAATSELNKAAEMVRKATEAEAAWAKDNAPAPPATGK